MKKYTFNCTLFTRDLRLNVECPEHNFQKEVVFDAIDEWYSFSIFGKLYDIHLLLDTDSEGNDLWEVSIYKCKWDDIKGFVTDTSEEATQIVNLAIHDTNIDEPNMGEILKFVVYFEPEDFLATVETPNGAQLEVKLPKDIPQATFLYEDILYHIVLVTEHPGEMYGIRIYDTPIIDEHRQHDVVTYVVGKDDPDEDEEEFADCIAREYEWHCTYCRHMNIFYEWSDRACCSECGEWNNIAEPSHAIG